MKQAHNDAATAPGMSAVSTKTVLLYAAIIVVVSAAVYFNTLYNGFVYDDTVQVVQNPWIRDLRHLPDIFSGNAYGFRKELTGNYYRPVMNLIYMFNFHVFGLAPWGFHLVNIIFHSGVSMMVYLLMLEFLGKPGARNAFPSAPAGEGDAKRRAVALVSLIIALLFAVHPIHTEAVAWIAGVTEVSFAFFYLLSLYLYIRATADGPFKARSYLLSVFLFFPAVLCKETALTLPLMLAAYDYFLKEMRGPLSGYFKRYLSYLLVAGLYFVLRFNALGGFAPHKEHADLGVYRMIINIMALFSQYLEKLVLPVHLNAFYVFHPISSAFETSGILALLITGLFVAFGLLAGRKNGLVSFSLLFIVVPLLPVFYIPGLGQNTFTERYLYLPSVGFAILSALLLRRAIPAGRNGNLILAAATVIVLGLYSAGTINRNAVWRDDHTLFADTVAKSPDGAIPHFGLGFALMNEGRWDEAENQFGIALALDPGDELAHYNLGLVLMKKGMMDDAVMQFETALKISPWHAEAHNNLGTAYFAMGYKTQAFEHFEAATRLEPDNAEAYNNLGTLYGESGMIDKAIYCFEMAVRLSPGHRGFQANLQKAYQQKGYMDADGQTGRSGR